MTKFKKTIGMWGKENPHSSFIVGRIANLWSHSPLEISVVNSQKAKTNSTIKLCYTTSWPQDLTSCSRDTCLDMFIAALFTIASVMWSSLTIQSVYRQLKVFIPSGWDYTHTFSALSVWCKGHFKGKSHILLSCLAAAG